MGLLKDIADVATQLRDELHPRPPLDLDLRLVKTAPADIYVTLAVTNGPTPTRVDAIGLEGPGGATFRIEEPPFPLGPHDVADRGVHMGLLVSAGWDMHQPVKGFVKLSNGQTVRSGGRRFIRPS
jgi:hypothetical protein